MNSVKIANCIINLDNVVALFMKKKERWVREEKIGEFYQLVAVSSSGSETLIDIGSKEKIEKMLEDVFNSKRPLETE